MNALERTFRFLSPKWYCQWGLSRAKRERSKKLKAARSLPKLERQNLIARLEHDVYEWADWLREMEDRKLVRRAAKMDVYLDDIPFPKLDEEGSASLRPSHYELGPYGNELLHNDTRTALEKAMREQFPAYRKERRDILQLWINLIAVLIGLVGAATALVVAWRK